MLYLHITGGKKRQRLKLIIPAVRLSMYVCVFISLNSKGAQWLSDYPLRMRKYSKEFMFSICRIYD